MPSTLNCQLVRAVPILIVFSAAVLGFTAKVSVAQEKTRPFVTDQPAFSHMTDENLRWRPCVNSALKGCEAAVIRGDPTTGPAEVFVRVQAGNVVPEIWHSTLERGLLLQGKFVGSDPQGKEFVVTPGAYWYMPAGVTHGGVRCSNEGPCLMYERYETVFDINLVDDAKTPQRR